MRQQDNYQTQPYCNYKTIKCKNLLEHGYCKYGPNCKYAHGEKELRNPHDPIESGIQQQNHMANMAYLEAFVTQPPPKTSKVVIKKLTDEKNKLLNSSAETVSDYQSSSSIVDRCKEEFQFDLTNINFQKEDALLLSTSTTTAPQTSESLVTPEKRKDPLISMLQNMQTLQQEEMVEPQVENKPRQELIDMINQLYPLDLLQHLEPPKSTAQVDSSDQIKVIILNEDQKEGGDEDCTPVLSSTKQNILLAAKHIQRKEYLQSLLIVENLLQSGQIAFSIPEKYLQEHNNEM